MSKRNLLEEIGERVGIMDRPPEVATGEAIVPLNEMPSVGEAVQKVLRARRELAEAQQRVDELQKQLDGGNRIATLGAQIKIPSARLALSQAEVTNAQLEEDLARIRDMEGARIIASRDPDRRALVAELNEALERAAKVNDHLVEHEIATERLAGKSFVIRAQFVPVMRETPTQDSFLPAWQRAMRGEGLL